MVKKLLSGLIWTLVIGLSVIYTIGGGIGRDSDGGILPDTLAFAHRGVRPAVENSSLAIQRGLDLPNLEAVELDVRQTGDGGLVLFHDPTTDRLTESSRKVDECKLSELQEMRLLGSEQGIISLDSALRLTGRSLYVYLDLKDADRSMVKRCIALLDQHQLFDRVVIASSRYQMLAFAKANEPRVQTVLEGFTSGKVWLRWIFPRKWQPDYFALFVGDLTPEHREAMAKADLLSDCIVYGVEAGAMIPNGVNRTVNEVRMPVQPMED